MIELRVTHRRHAENDTLNIRQEAYNNVIAYLLHSVSQPCGNTDDGDEYFCSQKVHRLVTQIQHRTVVLFDIARLPLRAKC